MERFNKLYLDLEALATNFKTIKKSLSSKCDFATDISFDAFGVGAKEVMRILSISGCNKFFVASINEALGLRNSISITDTIFVDNGIYAGEEADFVQNYIIPVLNSCEQFNLFNSFALRKSKSFEAAIKITSNKGSLGFLIDDVLNLLEQNYFSKKIKIKAIIANIDSSDFSMLEKLKSIKNTLKVQVIGSHSGDILLAPPTEMNVLKLDLQIYGCNNSDSRFVPALTILSDIIQTRNEEHTYLENDKYYSKKLVLANIPFGLLKTKGIDITKVGKLYLNDNSIPFYSKIEMNSVCLDVSSVPDYDLKLGTEVEILGGNLSLDDYKRACDLNPKALLIALTSNTNRVYLS